MLTSAAVTYILVMLLYRPASEHRKHTPLKAEPERSSASRQSHTKPLCWLARTDDKDLLQVFCWEVEQASRQVQQRMPQWHTESKWGFPPLNQQTREHQEKQRIIVKGRDGKREAGFLKFGVIKDLDGRSRNFICSSWRWLKSQL